jgi:hypothetical protein
MYERETEGLKGRLEGSDEDSGDGLSELSVEQVLGTPGGNVLFAESPLAPSRPGCAGDLGTVAGARVVDVVEEPTGLLHVMDDFVHVESGKRVPIWRDPERRGRLERTHAATVACLALLAHEHVPVTSVEIVAGLAWIEVAEPAPALDLAAVAAREERIEVLARSAGRMKVYLDGRTVETVEAPIAGGTAAIAAAGVRPVAALGGGHEALEIALPDGEGRAWWL